MSALTTIFKAFYRSRIILYLALALIPLRSYSQYNENLLRAAYIGNIASFVEWPQEKWLDPAKKVVLAIYGDNDFMQIATIVFRDKKILNRKVEVKKISDPSDLKDCDLVYIGSENSPLFKSMILKANESGVVVFTESVSVSVDGVHFNFYIESDKLRFEINRRSLEKSGFRVSSVLLSNFKVNDR
jgi:hypothetical protein